MYVYFGASAEEKNKNFNCFSSPKSEAVERNNFLKLVEQYIRNDKGKYSKPLKHMPESWSDYAQELALEMFPDL